VRSPPRDPLHDWLTALRARHLADLQFAEVRRAVQALSSRYVGPARRRDASRFLDGAGKRAAFALYFGPLHFLVMRRIVKALGAERSAPRQLLDLGCGTGVCGAAWSLECSWPPQLTGVERHPWAVEEARWTYGQLSVKGRVVRGDLCGQRLRTVGSGLLAAYVLNELPQERREVLGQRLLQAGSRGARVLIVEPIARRITPWWGAWSREFEAAGGRTDTWRFPIELPQPLRDLDRAAGLDHRELTARTLYLPGRRR